MTRSARQAYVDAVTANYVRLPGTPFRASRTDRRFASELHQRGVPLHVVYAAFVLAVVRREIRSAALPRLAPIRTLAYFRSAIDEILDQPPDPEYIRYIASKIRTAVAEKQRLLSATTARSAIP
ncbi:MAG: hypothetical protein R6X23_14485 [Acidimicrobiia bacterium]